jgi:hypothetical protein
MGDGERAIKSRVLLPMITASILIVKKNGIRDQDAAADLERGRLDLED